MNAADVIARRLYAAGCRFAFGIPGGEVLALIDALERAMWTGPGACRPAGQACAEIALGRLANGRPCRFILHRQTVQVSDFDQSDVVVGARIRTGAAADAGLVVDMHVAKGQVALDRAGRATDQADRINAMHAGMGDHQVVM